MKNELTGAKPVPQELSAIDLQRLWTVHDGKGQKRGHEDSHREAFAMGQAAARAMQDAEIAALKERIAGWQCGAQTDAACMVSQQDEIAALRKALEFIIDVEDDTEKNPPEHRCYIEGTWKMAIDEARKAIAQVVKP